jgi:hypothetical protein
MHQPQRGARRAFSLRRLKLDQFEHARQAGRRSKLNRLRIGVVLLGPKTKRHRVRNPKEMKSSVRLKLGFYFAFSIPIVMVMITIILAALIVGALDIVAFMSTTFERLVESEANKIGNAK